MNTFPLQRRKSVHWSTLITVVIPMVYVVFIIWFKIWNVLSFPWSVYTSKSNQSNCPDLLKAFFFFFFSMSSCLSSSFSSCCCCLIEINIFSIALIENNREDRLLFHSLDWCRIDRIESSLDVPCASKSWQVRLWTHPTLPDTPSFSVYLGDEKYRERERRILFSLIFLLLLLVCLITTADC